jgi:hypothetical protein
MRRIPKIGSWSSRMLIEDISLQGSFSPASSTLASIFDGDRIEQVNILPVFRRHLSLVPLDSSIRVSTKPFIFPNN